MCPPTAFPVADIEFDCCAEEIYMSLLNMIRGCPLPSNVVPDVIPYHYAPSDLPKKIWYLVRSKGIENTELGLWKVKGEPCKLFSDSTFTGWRTTFEFFEGQVPDRRKTDWLMEEYWIAWKGLVENSNVKEATSLFRVFLGSEEGTYVGEQQLVSQAYDNVTDSGSTSKHEAFRDDETTKLAVAGRPVNHVMGISPENDYLSRGDFLEMLDLDNPASPSSSSDNSSCMTMSSDEYFDSLALLQDLERGSNQNSTKEEGCKFNVAASIRPDEKIMTSASPGTFIRGMPTNESSRGTNLFTGCSTNARNDPDDRNLQNAVRDQMTDCKDEGSSSNCHDIGTSSGRSNSSRGKKLKKKYPCFMPFHFLF
ncbi:hypothetical protein K2173_027730 [Erythroxylum novogranatense]|uniref:NAC domain-containing protein n=1 Tax=Erythroxylum novogranatense TaxID=1862640 RepID=A0AAV8U2G1_9ROSI|nr:hypothetical protein K2173_027730 [Erythroxylum novogranatense]